MAGRQRGNGSGSVTKYKTSKGKIKYRVRVSLGTVFDEEKLKFKAVEKSLGVFDTKAQAEAVLAEYNNSPYDLESKVKTVGDLYKTWSESYFAKLKGESSIRTITSAWKYCKDIEKLPLKKLNKGHIEAVMDKGYVIIENGKKKGEKRFASTNTKCRIKSIFNLMLDYACDNNLVVKNVARQFDVNDMRQEVDYNKKIKQPFTQDEIDLLWKNVDELPFVDMILVGIYGSWRPDEVCNLKTKYINLSDTDIEVEIIKEDGTIQKRILESGFIMGGNKTQAGINRKVPIHPLIRPLVEKRYKQAQGYGSEYLFNDRFSQTGLHVTYDKLRHKFETIMAELGIKDRTGHCMRVTFITKCYQAGIPEHIIKRFVGHSLKGNVTDEVYNRVTSDELFESICKIEK